MIPKRLYPLIGLVSVVAVVAAKLAIPSAEHLAEECTRLAAHPDENLPTGGVALSAIRVAEARAACAKSLTKLDRPELHYRFARTLIAGQPSDADKALALQHVKIAYDAKVRLAPVLLANLHSAGLGTPFNPELALELLAAPIAEGIPSAMILGATIELDQSDKTGHVERGLALLERAGAGGTPTAYLTMGDYLARRSNPQRAIWAFQQADNAGLAAGAYGLGLTYGAKGSVVSDPARAFLSFSKAAAAGHVASQGQVALALHDGNGVAKNLQDALRWAIQGSKNGDSVSQYIAGYMLFYGEGASKDGLEAERHLQLAIANNHVAARELYEASVRAFAAALKTMPAGSASGCSERRTSRYDDKIIEYYNRCANALNVLVCKRFLATEVASLFDRQNRESCGVRKIAPNAYIDDLYGADTDSSFFRVLVSQTQIQLWACYYPLTPNRTGDTATCKQ